MIHSKRVRCYKCGMIRSIKDLVLLEDGNYMCFSCWNDYYKAKANKKSI